MSLKSVSSRTLIAVLALGALCVFSARLAPVAEAADKAVNVEVEVHNVPGITEADVEDLAEKLFASAGQAVTEEDGPDVLVVHLIIEGDDDGSGFTIHVAAGAFKGDVDFDSADDLDDALHNVVEDVEGEDE